MKVKKYVKPPHSHYIKFMGFRFMENQSFRGLLDKQNQVLQMMSNLGNDSDTLGLLKSC